MLKTARPFGYVRCGRCDGDSHSCACITRRLARYVATACRALAVLFRSVAAGLELLANDYNAIVSAKSEPVRTELPDCAVRLGHFLPPAALADEIELRDAIRQALRRYLPDEAPGKA